MVGMVETMRERIVGLPQDANRADQLATNTSTHHRGCHRNSSFMQDAVALADSQLEGPT